MSQNFLQIRNGITFNPQSGVPNTPIDGDLYYDASQNTYIFYNNGNWINLSSQVDVASIANLTSAELTATVVQNSLVRITGSTASNLDGLAASTAGKQVLIYNVSTAALTVQNQSETEPTAANRILTYNGGPITVASGQTMLMVYDDVQTAWIAASAVGTGSSSGSGGTGDDLDALQYNASFTDTFPEAPTVSTSSINSSGTNATFSASTNSYSISYDAGKTLTGTGTSMTLSAAPAYTMAIGDIVIFGSVARKITAISSQTAFTIEAAFSTNPSAVACIISQAIYTKDINNFAVDGVAIGTQYTDDIVDALVTYNDTASGTTYNYMDPPLIAYTVSTDNTNFSSLYTREANLSMVASYAPTPTSGTSLYIRFFANVSSGSGSVNLINYKAFFHRESQVEVGGILNQAYCFTNSVGTPINCSNPTVVGGVTQVITTFVFPINVNPGDPNGSITVFLNGQKIPRFVNSTITPDASYVEVSPNTIQLDKDYSSYNYNLEIYQNVAIIDVSSQNTSDIVAIQQTLSLAPTVQKFLSNGLVTGVLFTITSATVVAGDTYTNNSYTFTVLNSGTTTLLYTSYSGAYSFSGSTLTQSSGSGPSTLTFSAYQSMGTYTLPTSPQTPLYIRVRMVGGGGGGWGGGSSAGSTPTAGQKTVFGTSLLVANGGNIGSGYNTGGGTGGTVSLGSGPIGLALQGGSGGGSDYNGGVTVVFCGGIGGNSALGGSGGTAESGGLAGATNTGGGGGGGATAFASGQNSGPGGGSGGFIDAIIYNPSTTYVWTVGNGGSAGGAGGGGGSTGGAGGSGIIIVEEYYS